ncbi:hypothetical protein DFH08DRAFT_828670 [Mycena albidolilacea]|uniref:Uncharacterized protein n=1 Tax=Mycena albidolilacea TaxID=1033008 RepID=A0AAD7AT68_9AGAR|nr:hypothetical protein DFH08DRAFT_828670 [Mycena albidolilacea]
MRSIISGALGGGSEAAGSWMGLAMAMLFSKDLSFIFSSLAFFLSIVFLMCRPSETASAMCRGNGNTGRKKSLSATSVSSFSSVFIGVSEERLQFWADIRTLCQSPILRRLHMSGSNVHSEAVEGVDEDVALVARLHIHEQRNVRVGRRCHPSNVVERVGKSERYPSIRVDRRYWR